MAITLPYTANDGEIPTGANFMANFNQLINNPIDFWSPATKTVDMNGFELILDVDADTSIVASTDDRIDVKASGVSSLFRLDGTVASPVNGVHLIAAATGVNPRVEADGTDTNVGLRLAGQGTGAVVGDGPVALLAQMLGFSNISFTATVAANALTIALKDAAGNDPTVASPCKVWLRSSTVATGAPVHLSRTSALSIVVPSGATLGTTNNTTYRIYWGMTTLDGTTWDELCVFNTQATNQLYALPSESATFSATAISASSNSAGTLYSTSGTTNRPVKWLGYIEITEATAGTWATAPVVLMMDGPGVPKGGQVLQTKQATTATETTNNTSTLADTTLTVNITPSNVCNRVFVAAFQNGVRETTTAGGIVIQLARAATALLTTDTLLGQTGTLASNISVAMFYLDAPASTSSTQYLTTFRHGTNNAGATVQNGASTSLILTQEIFA